MISVHVPIQCQVELSEFLGVGMARILIAQGDGDRHSTGHAAKPWSGCRKKHEGKLGQCLSPTLLRPEEGRLSQDPQSGWGWPSCARIQGIAATGSPAFGIPAQPSSGHFKHPLRLRTSSYFQRAIWRRRDKSPGCQDGCWVKIADSPLSTFCPGHPA